MGIFFPGLLSLALAHQVITRAYSFLFILYPSMMDIKNHILTFVQYTGPSYCAVVMCHSSGSVTPFFYLIIRYVNGAQFV